MLSPICLLLHIFVYGYQKESRNTQQHNLKQISSVTHSPVQQDAELRIGAFNMETILEPGNQITKYS